ncbi:FAD-dependent oxidoreductase [Chelatococcus sp. SYSU_G07232]|uniref:FAD-dependent oxidoreductase n=1 Tax=Chelatococcus albus TaxID=3047466 RepID=A0ABT7AE98_9HYPH|nr:FAD-dependent oxidoreductase [Chelatococcus sp. SYSU_G07232]MDJ1157698.1 FAD-dependent oxidoreductase [Chelatococcus sp. SYSU_G07232]
MPEILRPDLCVIGAGSGGLSVAAAAAMLGVPVVLVERDRMGGDCLNVGCVPSKALIAAGDRAQAAREAAAFGLNGLEPHANYARVRDHVRSVIAAIAPNDSEARFTALGVRVIKGEARFLDKETIVVGEVTVKARRFVVATGSRPAVPPIPGLDGVPYLTNETVFDLTRRPERLIVIGAGPVGLELAQAHRRLGAEVVVLEAERALAHEDPEIAAHALAAIRREGVTIREAVRILRVETAGAGVRIVLAGAEEGEEIIDGSHLLVAAGRQAVVDGLDLEAAGIATDKGGVITDAGLRTTNRRVFAVGDCVGGPFAGYRFTHVANYHAGLVVRRALFRRAPNVDYATVPRVTYIDPEVASVGLLEEEARARHGAIRVLRWPFAENDRAQAERTTRGEVKVIVSRRGRILGCSIAGPRAGELIVPWTLAVARRLSVKDLAGIVFPYPTLSEVSRRAAMSFYAPLASSPWVRALVGLLRRLG